MKTQALLSQPVYWARGTRMQMGFDIDGEFVFVKGIVTKNGDSSWIIDDESLNEGKFSVHFDDDDKMDFDHKNFSKEYDAIALDQTDPSTLSANMLLSLLGNKRPNIQSLSKVLEFKGIEGMQFRHRLQGATEFLLNSEPGSADRTERMRSIVNQIKPFYEKLKDNPRVKNKATCRVLRWLTNIAHFESHISLSVGSSSVNAVASSVNLNGNAEYMESAEV
jgi:hypothetical protein